MLLSMIETNAEAVRVVVVELKCSASLETACNQAIANMVKLGCKLSASALRDGRLVNNVHLYGVVVDYLKLVISLN